MSNPDLAGTAGSPSIIDCPIVIATSTTVSSEVDLNGTHLFAIGTPAALTGTAITFQVSDTGGGTFNALYDDSGTQYSVTVAPSRVIYLDPSIFAAFRFLKLVSGSAESANRTLKLYTRAV